jgi:TRAP-type C4-dicarboxylate transport system substrate-binding protein
MRRLALTALLCAAWAMAPAAGPAAAQEVTLTLHHLLSPKSLAHSQYLEPWARRVEEQSGGRIKVEIFPSMSLGGAPPELYRQVRDGTVDMAWTVLGYTPGVFIRSEVFELPFVHENSARATNLAIQDLFEEYLAPDFADVKPILLHVHSGQAIHMVERPVNGIADLKGLKLRTPSRTGAWMIESWDAEPVGMPVPDLPQALSKGVVDGALIPYEIAMPLKVYELTNYSIEGENAVRFGTIVFMFAMNKERYASLPDDLKAVIDANSGGSIAAQVGEVWDSVEPKGRELTRGSGSTIIELDDAAMAGFRDRAGVVIDRWIEEVSAQGIDGKALVEAAREAIARHKK